jgi:hypothetical protein
MAPAQQVHPLAGSDLARLVELELLADAATFPHRIRVTATPSGIELGGVVSNERARARSLAIARQVAQQPVLDRMQSYRELRERQTVANPNLAYDAQARLEREGPQPTLGPIDIEIEADAQGVVTLFGRVGTLEEKVLAARCLRGVPGCDRVVNRLEVARLAAQPVVQTSLSRPPDRMTHPQMTGIAPLSPERDVQGVAQPFPAPAPLTPPRTLNLPPAHSLKPLPMPAPMPNNLPARQPYTPNQQTASNQQTLPKRITVASPRPAAPPVMTNPGPALFPQPQLQPQQPMQPPLHSPLQHTSHVPQRGTDGADFYRQLGAPAQPQQPMTRTAGVNHPTFNPVTTAPRTTPQSSSVTPAGGLRQRIAATLAADVRTVDVNHTGPQAVTVEMRVRPNANLDRIISSLYAMPELAGYKIDPRFFEE